MPVIWIHRVAVCDLLVKFDTVADAYKFGRKVLSVTEEYNEETDGLEENNIGQTPTLQVILVPDSYEHKEHWNPVGFVTVTSDEALLLSDDKEPEGFIPNSYEGPCA